MTLHERWSLLQAWHDYEPVIQPVFYGPDGTSRPIDESLAVDIALAVLAELERVRTRRSPDPNEGRR